MSLSRQAHMTLRVLALFSYLTNFFPTKTRIRIPWVLVRGFTKNSVHSSPIWISVYTCISPVVRDIWSVPFTV